MNKISNLRAPVNIYLHKTHSLRGFCHIKYMIASPGLPSQFLMKKSVRQPHAALRRR